MRLAIVLCVAATAVFAGGGQRGVSPRVRPSGVVAILLAEGRLILVDAATGRQLAEHVTPRAARHAVSVGRLARAASGDELFAVLFDEDVPVLVAVNMRTFAQREVARLPFDTYPALAIGDRTGRVFAFRSVDAVVIAVDARTGEQRTLLSFQNGRQVYSGAVSADERRVYVSYHGIGTGIDWFDQTNEEWRPGGYLASHGGFVLAGKVLLAATGNPNILEVDAAGRTLRAFNTALYSNHVMEFAVDVERRIIYAVGSCGYGAGFTSTPWPRSGSAPARVLVPVRDYSVCGERISLGPDGAWAAVAVVEDSVPRASRPGRVLILDSRTGGILQQRSTSSDVVDVLAVR